MCADSTASCFNCEKTEHEAALLSARHAGQSIWVCAQCMPAIIHEPQQVADKLRALKGGSA